MLSTSLSPSCRAALAHHVPDSPMQCAIIDNELHAETSTSRLRYLAAKRGISDDVQDRVRILNLRGKFQDLGCIEKTLLKVPYGTFGLVIVDAWYRTLPKGTSENDNGSITELYNRLDCVADAIGSSFVPIHHGSKGDQSAKTITDVGSGAGSQSRATDTHLVLRRMKWTARSSWRRPSGHGHRLPRSSYAGSFRFGPSPQNWTRKNSASRDKAAAGQTKENLRQPRKSPGRPRGMQPRSERPGRRQVLCLWTPPCRPVCQGAWRRGC